jgi:hypothetical protein
MAEQSVSRLEHDQAELRDFSSQRSARSTRNAEPLIAWAHTSASIALAILLIIAGSATHVRAQSDGAAINEALAGAIYVNPKSPSASDTNPGTSASLPFRTIGRAVDVALTRRQRNVATKIEISPATYRESVEVAAPSSTAAAPIILEAVGKGPVVISGANVWIGWNEIKPGIWTHQWPYRWGIAANPPGWESQRLSSMVKRREMIMVNGSSLTQVEAPGTMQNQPGSFYVDESGGTAYLHVPSGVNLSSATIEVSERESLLRVRGPSHVAIRGITFQNSNGPLQQAAVTIENSSDVLIDHCKFNWNNWMGLSVRNVNNLTIRNSVANYNGGVGMTIWRADNMRFSDNETSHNNWRGAAGGFTGWAVAGIKSLQITNSRYDGLIATDNLTRGLWFDTACSNVIVDHAFLCDNNSDGVFIEANQGPLEITSSIICNNQSGAGVLAGNSSNVTLEGNIIYGNQKSQILVSGFFDAPRPMKNRKTGQTLMLESDQWKIARNVIVSTGGGSALLSTTLSKPVWNTFVDSLSSRNNVWYNASNPNSLRMAGGTSLSLPQWQQQFGQDKDSVFADPRFRDPQKDDFTLAPGSPLTGRRLPSAPGKGTD